MAMKPGNGGGGNGERDPRLDVLYRDAPREAPPSHLDAAILAAARREVGARPRALSALRRWRVPVSIAAVVVLSASLVTVLREEGTEKLMDDARSPAAPAATQPAAPPALAAEPAQAPGARARMGSAAPEEFSLRRDEALTKAPAESRNVVGGEPARSAVRSPAEPDIGATAGTLSSEMRESSPQRPGADAPQPHAPSVAVRGLDSGPPAAAPQPKPRAEGKMQAEQALAMKRPPAWHGLEQEPPQKWLERLADLRKQGRTGEANELLAELKRRFPDHPLPSGVE